MGYCEGNNIGIRNAKGEFVVILNPDTVVDDNWLKELINGYKKFGLIVGSVYIVLYMNI